MLRVLAIIGGVSGAVALSQFPEFSQQYLQRLAGQVDALALITSEFDTNAAAHDLTREAALAQISGTAFLTDQQAALRGDFARFDRLSDNLSQLRAATPLARLTMPQRFGDAATLRATYADFRPAIPATTDGAITAGVGYVAGWAISGLVLSLLAWPFRRRVVA